MESPGSVTQWLGQLKAGDQAAGQELWQRYFQRLVGLARKNLRGAQPPLADEEDVALSAFNSFFLGTERGCFPKLTDRDDLWQILVMLTARKVSSSVKHQGRKKRGGEIAIVAADFEQIIGSEPTPEFAAQLAEEARLLLDRLDDELRQVAVWKMEGYTNEEIAQMLGCVERSVERKLKLIRLNLTEESPE